MKDFQIAVTVAAPGTGKTRLIDDALRMPLDAKPGEQKHFDHFLRLAVTFNTNYGGSYAHPLTARLLLMFFCGTIDVSAEDVLERIDAKLIQLFPSEPAKILARNVLDALEALYFDQRGDKLGRTVLLIDEISKAKIHSAIMSGEDHVYEATVGWVNGGVMASSQVGRRGAVFTGLSAIAPWSKQTPRSGRSIVWLLGTFDLWDEKVRYVVAEQAKAIENWPADAVISDRVWYLLAATGGRPRDVSSMLQRLRPVLRRTRPFTDDLLKTLFVPKQEAEVQFRRYLLPSMLSIKFFAMIDAQTITQFGRDAASPALLNADQLASGKVKSVAPSVSLGHAAFLEDENDKLFDEIKALILSTTFCKLDGSGKDFERVWVLLVHTVLRLQHIARFSDSDFWPRLVGGSVDLGGLARPTTRVLDVFAADDSDDTRVRALFGNPDDERVCSVRGSLINRRLPLKREPPTLAWWQSVWSAIVEPGVRDDIPEGWPVALDVAWRPWTVAYFAEATHEAVDFALIVGDAGGTDASAPHVYLFQCKALTSRNVTQGTATTKDDGQDDRQAASATGPSVFG